MGTTKGCCCGTIIGMLLMLALGVAAYIGYVCLKDPKARVEWTEKLEEKWDSAKRSGDEQWNNAKRSGDELVQKTKRTVHE